MGKEGQICDPWFSGQVASPLGYTLSYFKMYMRLNCISDRSRLTKFLSVKVPIFSYFFKTVLWSTHNICFS